MDNMWCHNGTEDITQEIRTILEAQDVKVSEAVVGEIIHACSAYYSRMLIDRNENPAVKDLEKFLSGLKNSI